MSTRPRLDEAHTRAKEFAKELVEDGIADEDVIDALMGVGANQLGRIVGPDQLVAILRDIADQIETQGFASGQRH
jgi:hypothetical protein